MQSEVELLSKFSGDSDDACLCAVAFTSGVGISGALSELNIDCFLCRHYICKWMPGSSLETSTW